jgi:hypothetical protein
MSTNWPTAEKQKNYSEPANSTEKSSDYEELDISANSIISDNVFSPGSTANTFQFPNNLHDYSSSGSSVLYSSDLMSLTPSTMSSTEGFRAGSTNVENLEAPNSPNIKDLVEQIKTELIISPKKVIYDKKKDEPDLEVEKFEDDEVIFSLKKWNHVSLWKWDVDCDICAICRLVISDPCVTVITSIY